MITENDLTDKVIAKDVLGWEYNPDIGWCTRTNTIEERLPSFKTDARWTGLLWSIALPIMQKTISELKPALIASRLIIVFMMRFLRHLLLIQLWL